MHRAFTILRRGMWSSLMINVLFQIANAKDRSLAFHFPTISIFISGKPYLQRPLFKNEFSLRNEIVLLICIIACSDTIDKHFGNASYFKFPYGLQYAGIPTLPQNDVEAARCLDVTAFTGPNIRPIAI
jgi:hypothetical protein